MGQENLFGVGVFVKEKCRHQESSTVIIFGHSCRISSDQDIFEVLGHRVTMIKFIINETRNTIMILSLYFLPLILQEFMIMIMIMIFNLHM